MPGSVESVRARRMAVSLWARERRRRAFLLTIVLCAIYFGYLSAVLISPGSMRVFVLGNISLGLALGVLAIVMTWLLAFVHVVQADHADAGRLP